MTPEHLAAEASDFAMLWSALSLLCFGTLGYLLFTFHWDEAILMLIPFGYTRWMVAYHNERARRG